VVVITSNGASTSTATSTSTSTSQTAAPESHTSSLSPTPSPAASSTLGSGAKIGIAIGAVAIALLLALLSFLLLRQKRRHSNNPVIHEKGPRDSVHEVDAVEPPREMEAKEMTYYVAQVPRPGTAISGGGVDGGTGSDGYGYALHGFSTPGVAVYELPSPIQHHRAGSELDGEETERGTVSAGSALSPLGRELEERARAASDSKSGMRDYPGSGFGNGRFGSGGGGIPGR
jgi:hypothetical protein